MKLNRREFLRAGAITLGAGALLPIFPRTGMAGQGHVALVDSRWFISHHDRKVPGISGCLAATHFHCTNFRLQYNQPYTKLWESWLRKWYYHFSRPVGTIDMDQMTIWKASLNFMSNLERRTIIASPHLPEESDEPNYCMPDVILQSFTRVDDLGGYVRLHNPRFGFAELTINDKDPFGDRTGKTIPIDEVMPHGQPLFADRTRQPACDAI